MQADQFPEVPRRIRSHLVRLTDFTERQAPLDKTRAEYWLARQLAFLDAPNPPIWADGPQAAWRAVAAEPWRDLVRQASRLAEAVATATVRQTSVYGPQPALASMMAAADKAAEDVVDDLLADSFQAAVSDPFTTRRLDGRWRYRWAHGRSARRSGVSEAWLESRWIRLVDGALRDAQRPLAELDEPTGWTSAWMEAWVSKWAELTRPTGREDRSDDKLAVLLETVGEQTAASMLRHAQSRLAGEVVQHARNVLYGAWRSLDELYKGPPATPDLMDWRDCMRNYWRPFYEQAAAGLASCWFTPDAVVCLPRPCVRVTGTRFVATWPNGEAIEGFTPDLPD